MDQNIIVTIAEGGIVTIIKSCSLYDLEIAAQHIQQYVNQAKQKTMVQIPTEQNETHSKELQEII